MGLSLPLVAAAIAVPRLIEQVGMERFGLLTVAWGLIGFAGVFDLGLGRAATQMISQLISEQKHHQVAQVIQVAAKLSLQIGIAGALLLGGAVYLGVQQNLKFDQSIGHEVELAAYMLAITIPIQAMSAMFRGVNEAFQAFRAINIIRMGLGFANFIAPLLMALITTNLAALVSTLLVSRLVALFFFKKYAYASADVDKTSQSVTDTKLFGEVQKRLLTFGGWVTVSNIVTPVLMQSDRLLIGALVSTAAVAVYVIPYEMVVQSLIICGAITTAMFPVFAGMAKAQASSLQKTFMKWLMVAAGSMLVITVGFLLMAQPVLALWLGDSLDEQSVHVANILAFGLVPYAVGSMYLALIHAHARPDVTAKAHLIEMPLFLLGLYWAVSAFGVYGAAVAWVARVTIDALGLVAWFHLWGKTKP